MQGKKYEIQSVFFHFAWMRFCRIRDWEMFHDMTPKELAMALRVLAMLVPIRKYTKRRRNPRPPSMPRKSTKRQHQRFHRKTPRKTRQGRLTFNSKPLDQTPNSSSFTSPEDTLFLFGNPFFDDLPLLFVQICAILKTGSASDTRPIGRKICVIFSVKNRLLSRVFFATVSA
ncbi:MAG: hypothetical protein FWH27_10510 [Planctomycetaceae bacterium]|nr:hypothetical protein [Planctomycetaceae bacterium]